MAGLEHLRDNVVNPPENAVIRRIVAAKSTEVDLDVNERLARL